MAKYEYKQEIIPYSVNETSGYKNSPDRMAFINEQALDGWRFVSSFIKKLWGKDISHEGLRVSATREREVMTFEREVS